MHTQFKVYLFFLKLAGNWVEANTLLDIFQTGMNPLKQLQIFWMSLLAHYQKPCDDICVDNGKAI